MKKKHLESIIGAIRAMRAEIYQLDRDGRLTAGLACEIVVRHLTDVCRVHNARFDPQRFVRNIYKEN